MHFKIDLQRGKRLNDGDSGQITEGIVNELTELGTLTSNITLVLYGALRNRDC